MTTKHAGILARRTLGALAALAVVAGAPMAANAQAHGGGGGGHGGGGGGGAHFSGGGGGHFGGHSGGGGVHFSGGGHSFAGGAPRSFGGATPHASFTARPGGAAIYRGNTVHYAASGNHVYGGYAGGGHSVASAGHFVSHPSYGHPGYGHPGYGHPGWGGSGRYWGGGYWGGRFWPGVHYGAGFAWFLPVLPFGYATYYWGGTPYYYYDNAYYAWDPSYNGYVATDPPPVAQSSGTDEPADAPEPSDDSATYVPQPSAADSSPNNVVSNNNAGPRGDWGGASDIFVYPRNGQSEKQTADDKFECHKWSVAQTGFDPTRSVNLQGTVVDYRRAMDACLDARGYSVK